MGQQNADMGRHAKAWATALLLLATLIGCGSSSSAPDLIDAVRTDPDDSGLAVSYLGGSCDTSASLDVDESSSGVHIVVRTEEPSGGACDAVGHLRIVRARLASPLGDRALSTDRNGRTIRLIPFSGGVLLAPHPVPAGFSTGTEQGATDDGESTAIQSSGPDPGGTELTYSWTLGYYSAGQTADPCLAGHGDLLVTQTKLGQDSPVPLDARKAGTRRVGSAPAEVFDIVSNGITSSRALAWSTKTEQIAVESRSYCAGDVLFDADQLVAVAETLLPFQG